MSWKSRLCIYDLGVEESQILLETKLHIEAPNWSPDGQFLIVNGGGKLYRVALEKPELRAIETGDLTRLNNDHGISPDGQTLAISDHSADNKSAIYELPIAGGAPKRITKNVPSWWHGWSPDGARHAYTAVREGRFGIWTCPTGGGAERCLVESDHHYDGPDYTPNGQWVWFNSDRGGAMDLWRVAADGTALEQMSDDRAINWFPHPSPDGAHVLYLAYPEGTFGHPADLEVRLRLMPARGGAARDLVSLFGGQGTINVPCWAPGSGHFAYVEYARP
ncbi:MAG: Tol biopolymer transport system component [Halocynthiibacter sp.]|jgi:Tol biopolymer transport system component